MVSTEDDFFVEPHLMPLPDPKKDPVGYTRHFLERERRDLGERISVKPEDLTDDFVQGVIDSGKSWGNAIIELDQKLRSKPSR